MPERIGMFPKNTAINLTHFLILRIAYNSSSPLSNTNLPIPSSPMCLALTTASYYRLQSDRELRSGMNTPEWRLSSTTRTATSPKATAPPTSAISTSRCVRYINTQPAIVELLQLITYVCANQLA